MHTACPPPHTVCPPSPSLPLRDKAVGAGLLIAALALRLAGVREYRFNSDEAQHAHVAWGWTRGLLQYRDLFDNHTPLFHLLWAPLLAAGGESVRTLYWLRLTMLPLYLATLLLTWTLGKRLFAPRAAWWGTVLAALLPPFFVKTLEFRTDVPWTLLWMAAFQVLAAGAPTAGRLFAAGLLIGAAAAVSLKSSLLIACLLAAALVTAVVRRQGRRRAGALPAPSAASAALGAPAASQSDCEAAPAPQHHPAFLTPALRVLAALAGALAIPAAIALYFQSKGALDALLTGAVRHNLTATAHAPMPLRRAVLLVVGLPLLALLGRWARRAEPAAGADRRLLLVLTAGLYLIAMQVVWPLVTSQTYLPVEPLVCLVVAALVLGTGKVAAGPQREVARPQREVARPQREVARPQREVAAKRRALAVNGFVALALVVELAIDLLHGPLRGDQTRPQRDLVAAALALTGPDEAVFDNKGDMVFRRRAFYPVLEDITLQGMASGRIADTIPESILAAHACVATLDSRRLPPRGRAFLAANFLPVGPLRVCGRLLPTGEPGAPGLSSPTPLRFTLEIPADYLVVGPQGPLPGRLDGVEMTAPRHLATGPHVFEPRAAPPYALLWARAAAGGFSPFAHPGMNP